MDFWIVVGAVILVVMYWNTKKSRKAVAPPKTVAGARPRDDREVVIEIIPPQPEIEKQVVEVVTNSGSPAFRYRFRAHLEFDTPSEALLKHRTEDFIERPNGNRDLIEDVGGWWGPVSEWERPEWAHGDEDERFKYIGGVQVYIDFLLSIRAVYEGRGRTPQSKRDAIRKFCEDNRNVYTVKHVYQPPWETLIVPVLGLAEGFGPHRVGLLEAVGVRSIHDVESRSDRELLEIKGIGKAAVSGLRNLASHWPYDKFTDCIEKDEQYRAPAK